MHTQQQFSGEQTLDTPFANFIGEREKKNEKQKEFIVISMRSTFAVIYRNATRVAGSQKFLVDLIVFLGTSI